MSQKLDNEIVHRRQGGQSMRGIARDLGISRWRVERTLALNQSLRSAETDKPVNAQLPKPSQSRRSKLDQYLPAIEQLLERYPNMTAVRIFEELKTRGYAGGFTTVREKVKTLRRRPNSPLTVRFETAAGVQAQMDWSSYDIVFTQEGRRRVNLFSYILGYSRRQYIVFSERQDFEATVRGHVQAFEHLQGVAATCLYDNMKVVVTRWEDDQPLYNVRFLAFATHYGYRPWACRPFRPQTKGKVERPFQYVESSLLGGRTFRSLEHLNEVTRWWLANVADVRVHGTTKKRPIDLHAEEQAHLLPLPANPYDTARVVYRVVDSEGLLVYANNQYSAPWRLIGQLLPVRITEKEVIVYNHALEVVGMHLLLEGVTGQRCIDPAHRPPPNYAEQLEQLRQRYRTLGEAATRFLEGLLKRPRGGRQQAQRVLVLLRNYQREDGLAAMERAVRYHAYSLSSLEHILASQAKPKAAWQLLSDNEQEALRKLSDGSQGNARPSAAYQYLLFDQGAEDDEQTTSKQQGGFEPQVYPDHLGAPDDTPNSSES
ncbi:MAG: IS21 family transposase [Pirellulaceae bacterium]